MQLVIISSKSLYCNIPVYFFFNVKKLQYKTANKTLISMCPYSKMLEQCD